MPNDLPDWATQIARPDSVLPGSPMAYINGFTSVNFTMPTGTHILSIVLPGYLFVSQMTVTGVSTSVVYLAETPSTDVYQHQYYVLIPEGADTEVTVGITASVAGNAYVTAVSDTVAVASLPQNAAPWEAPNRAPLIVFFKNPGPATAQLILGGQGGNRSIWLHTFQWMWDVQSTSVTGSFEDTTPVQVGSTAATVAGQSYFMDFKGAQLTPTAGFQFLQSGTAAFGTSTCRGSLTYSVY